MYNLEFHVVKCLRIDVTISMQQDTYKQLFSGMGHRRSINLLAHFMVSCVVAAVACSDINQETFC